MSERYHKSVRFTREPTQMDKEAFSTFVHREPGSGKVAEQAEEADDEDEDSAVEADDAGLEEEFGADDDDVDALMGEDASGTVQLVPTWTPNFSIYHQIFRTIAQAGPKGMSSAVSHA